MSAALYLVTVEKAGGQPLGDPGRTVALVESVTKDARGGLCLKAEGRTLRYFSPGTYARFVLQGPYADASELMGDAEVEPAIKERVRRLET